MLRLAAVALLAAFGSAGLVLSTASAQPAARAVMSADLPARAEAEGAVPVLIRLRADLPRAKSAATSPGAWLRAQSAAVAQAQAPVVADLAARGVRLRHVYRSVPLVAARVTAADLRALAADPRVLAVLPDRLSRPLAPSLRSARAPSDVVAAGVAHAAGYTGAGQQVVVLDDGLDHDDARFAGRIATSACFSTNFDFGAGQPKSFSLCADSADVQTELRASHNKVPRCTILGANRCGHGHNVALTAAGIAPGASVIPVQVYARFEDFPDVCGANPCILSYTSDQVAALDHVVALADSLDGAGDPAFAIAAVNMSIGSGAETAACDGDARKGVIDVLRALGIATVIAAGNGGNTDAGTVPGCISTAITVGIATEDDQIADNADISPIVDFVAPGRASSFTAPVLAAAWAIYRAARPDASVDSVAGAFTRSARLIDDQRSGGVETDLPRLQLASALGLLVTTTEDGAGGSVRQALHDVRGDATTFADSLSGDTFALPLGPLAVARAFTLDASALAEGAALDAGGTHRIAEVAATGVLTLRGLTLANGAAGAGDGGALTNAGTLRLEGVTITGGSAARGGALATSGSAVLVNATLSGNAASGAGGGVLHTGGTLDVVTSTVYANTASSGAAQVESTGGTLRLLGAALGASPAGRPDCAAAGPLVSTRSHAEDGSCGAAQSGALGLGPLEGAPVATHAPGPGSALADAGTCDAAALLGTAVTRDARRLPRPVDLPSFADADDGCDIGAVEAQSEAALPVELVALTAAQNGARVVLTWTTASETNNAGFHVEVAEVAGGGWAERGFVAGAGTRAEAQTYMFALDDLAPGTHRVRLRQVDYDGTFAYSPEVEVAVEAARVLALEAAYPNPFAGTTAIGFSVPHEGHAVLTVYDAMGREVARLFEGHAEAGRRYAVRLSGASLAAGLYVYRLHFGGATRTGRVLHLR